MLEDDPLVRGKLGKGLSLSGTGDYIQTNWPGIGGRAPRTVALWVRLPQPPPVRDWESFLVWGDTSDAGGKFVVTKNMAAQHGRIGALRFNCRAGHVVGTTDLRDGKWHHVSKVFHQVQDEPILPDPILDSRTKNIFGKNR